MKKLKPTNDKIIDEFEKNIKSNKEKIFERKQRLKREQEKTKKTSLELKKARKGSKGFNPTTIHRRF